MAPPKATTQGTCQVCGRIQKLPGGVLANHGYNLTYKFFMGTCYGSGALPYELSCDLVKDSVRISRDSQERILRIIAQLERSENEYETTAYVAGKTLTGANGFIACRVRQSSEDPSKFLVEEPYGPLKTSITIKDPSKQNEKAVVRQLNESYIKHQRSNVRQLESFIKQQQDRLASWVRKPVMELAHV